MPEHSRILVVRAGALGDTLMATPVVTALRRRHPSASIDFLCSAPVAPLLDRDPDIARVIALRHRNLPYLVSPEKRRIARRLRASAYDLAVVLEHAPRYRDLVRRGRIGEVRGFHATPFDAALHAIANNLRAAGCNAWEKESLSMRLFLGAEDDEAAAALLAEAPGPHVGIHTGYGPAHRKRRQETRLKGWRRENFASVARGLADRGLTPVFTGTAGDVPVVRGVMAALPPGAASIDLTGRTPPRVLAAVIRRLALLVSVDSGPAHLAAAAGTPLIVLWGPAILEQVRPLAAGSPVHLVRHPVPCAPCYNTPLMRTCRRNICMEGITPDEVLGQVEQLLARSRFPVPSSQ